MNCRWDKTAYRKEGNGIGCLSAGMWKLKGIRGNTDKRRCSLYLGTEDVKCLLLDNIKKNCGKKKI